MGLKKNLTSFDQPFSLMFHHLTDKERHVYVQGALTADEFRTIISNSHGFKVLPAQEWLNRYESGKLSTKDICITFDDSLLSQYEIALPILNEFDLTAIWFVYSSVFEGVLEPFELHRFFRNTYFASVDLFYETFFEHASLLYPNYNLLDLVNSGQAASYLATHEFYSLRDRQFRYVRDTILTVQEYNIVMDKMMVVHNESLLKMRDKIWMSDEHLKALNDAGHVIGLHSYSHPVNFRRLSMEQQISEYFRNAIHLTKVLGYCPTVMAHPSNSYDNKTLSILRGFGVRFGFRSDMNSGKASSLEIQRMDHMIFSDSFLNH